VDGTKAVISAAQSLGIRKLVYTSSAAVVYDGSNLVDVDERVPYPKKALDPYTESKAKAEEMVLNANGEKGLLTVALRPAGIFGPGDRQVMTGFVGVWERNQTHFQVGDNTNLFDWTYVGNVAYAHLLAADRLAEELAGSVDTEKLVRERTSRALPPITVTIEHHRVPTSESRPLGPYVTLPPKGEIIEANWKNPDFQPAATKPMKRTRFDQFSENAFSAGEVPNSVAGQAFFVTNGEPMYFWDFARAVWKRLDDSTKNQRVQKSRITLPREIGLILASGAEWWGWLSGKQPVFTRFRVTFSCASRWYNIEKARTLLGYEPQTGMEDGVDKMVEWYLSQNPRLKA